GGKKDLFPVERSHIAVKKLTLAEIDSLAYKITQSINFPGIFFLEPSDLDRIEGRLLLHPYDKDRPEDHLYFKNDGEAAAWLGSKRGKESISTYDLNERSKVRARRAEQRLGWRRFAGLLAATPGVDDLNEWRNAATEVEKEYYGR